MFPPLKRTTVDFFKILRRRITISLAVILSLSLTFYLMKPNEVEIIEKSLNCKLTPCILSVSIKNNTNRIRTGFVAVNFLKIERASRLAGGDSGYVHRIFLKAKLPFTLQREDMIVLEHKYEGNNKTPLITANVVLKENY